MSLTSTVPAGVGGAVSAHGLGGAKDLPIPSELAIAGAVAALVISFTVLAVAWREPRYDAATSGRRAPEWLDRLVSSTALTVAARTFGMVAFLYVGAAAVLGQDTLINPFLGTFYVLLWVGLVPASLLLGPVFRAISPARTISTLFSKVSGAPPGEGLYAYPARLGYWPAAAGLFAFVWLELVYPSSTDLGPVRLWCAAYLGIMLVGSALFGTTFLARADPFEVYSSLVAKLSVWGRRDGRLVLRSPLANLDTVVARPGLVAVVAVLFGSTAFDSFRESTAWLGVVQEMSVPRVLPDSLALVVFCAGVGLVLAAATMATGVTDSTPRRALPDLFAHSVVPIIVGYIVAHYLTYFVEYGQQTIIQLSDPFTRGDDYLGTADLQVNYWLSMHPTFLAVTKVVAVAVGHVVGVVAAHDRAVRLLPRNHQLTGQLPLLLAMVGFTVGGLYLLFAA
ncbi:hypothetical protein GCM10011376_24570 [Nocardioides flavus (ex Wang et al. 2016)]|uniref:Fenitrothion hydrolase n=1 Tax=Nocardioides flavus (ex Wang et al. 2016) TaxID=2058780 RepID=A0ABQ3HJJ5_9ACTN|nr:hypothetical protein [Nocardioides flavus (ex Wang et al. 2016)]GHE17847.1 hypothetical protein GCM10011376_24570 [Nocardioides flavus (ex Wang et al. 2016)]